MWTLRREAQQITAVQMIGEVIHADFKFLTRGEQLVFTAGHGSHRAWNILAHGLRGAIGEVEEVTPWCISFLLVPRAVSRMLETPGEKASAYIMVLASPTAATASSTLTLLP